MYAPGTIVLNTLSTGDSIPVRIVEAMGEGVYRVVDVRAVGTDKQLIRRNKTWAASSDRLSLAK